MSAPATPGALDVNAAIKTANKLAHSGSEKSVGNSTQTAMGKELDGGLVASCSSKSEESQQLNLLSLNDDVFHEILSHLSFDEVSKLRLVCGRFNEVCQQVLNKGFMAVQRYHNRCLKEMKAKLPRRESERRAHPLARHIDVLTGIETRLSLLSMTYYKYTVLGVFCFIPGKVLDECYRVLREVVVHKNPPKSYELLQELRDISSMAMEHFEEHIVPTMKRNQQVLGGTLRGGSNQAIRPYLRLLDEETDVIEVPLPPSPSPTLNVSGNSPSFIRAHSNCRSSPSHGASGSTTGSSAAAVSPGIKLELAVRANRVVINSQQKQIIELRKKLNDYSRKIVEQDKLLNDYGRKLTQLEQKLSLGSQQQPPAQSSLPVADAGKTVPAVSTMITAIKDQRKRVSQDSGAAVSRAKRTKTSSPTAFSMSLRNRKI